MGITEAGSSVGQTLKRKRLERGFDLADIARETRIPLRHLEAIEQDNYDRLPAYPYAVGFVRNYTKFLGLPADQIVQQFKSETTLLDPSVTVTAVEPLDESRVPSRGLVIGSILAGVALLSAIAYFALRTPEPDVAEETPLTATEDAAAPSPAPAASNPVLSDTSAPPVGTPIAPPAGTIDPNIDPNAAPVASNTATAAADPAIPGPAATPATVPPVTPVTGISPVGVVIRANEDSWIKVSDGGPKSLKVGILVAGETYTVPNVPGVTLRTGNAGGVDVFVNGRQLPSLGGKGVLVKDVSLDPASLLGRARTQTPGTTTPR
jgi:cytoskeletal protein RodZ